MKIGVDLGGSNLRAAVVGDDGALGAQLREAVGEPRDPETIADRVARICEQLAGDEAHVDIGVGIAAMLRDHEGTVANSPHLRWRDVPFGRLLEARLGPRFRVGIYNDVNAIIWGEAVAGAARGCEHVLGVYVGTGIGAGLIVNGQLVEGTSNCAGELGHTKVRWDEDAAPCACGSRGCIEAYIGGSYIQRRIQKELATGKIKTRALELAGGLHNVHPGYVDLAAAEGDEWALGLWTELAPLLAVTLGNAVALLNPERLILGGGVLSRCPTLYSLVETILMVAGNYPSIEPLRVVPAELGDDAGIVGAALLVSAKGRPPETKKAPSPKSDDAQ